MLLVHRVIEWSKGMRCRVVLTVFPLLLAVLLTASPGAAQTCAVAFRNVATENDFLDELFLADKIVYLERGTPGILNAYKQITQELGNMVELGEDFERTVKSLIELIIAADKVYTPTEVAKAIVAFDRLRSRGALFDGLIFPAQPPGSRATGWLSVAKINRGFLFEVVASDNLIRAGQVTSDSVVGMGLRLLDDQGSLLVEGDLVHRVSGGLRYIDFKARNGNWNLDELPRVRQALEERKVRQVAFAHEDGSPPPESFRNELTRINEILADQGLEEMQLIVAGTF